MQSEKPRQRLTWTVGPVAPGFTESVRGPGRTFGNTNSKRPGTAFSADPEMNTRWRSDQGMGPFVAARRPIEGHGFARLDGARPEDQ